MPGAWTKKPGPGDELKTARNMEQGTKAMPCVVTGERNKAQRPRH